VRGFHSTDAFFEDRRRDGDAAGRGFDAHGETFYGGLVRHATRPAGPDVSGRFIKFGKAGLGFPSAETRRWFIGAVFEVGSECLLLRHSAE